MFVQAALDENAGDLTNSEDLARTKEEIVKEFASKIRNRAEQIFFCEKVSAYLVIKTAQNAKKNMDSLAINIQRYYTKNREEKLEESEILNLCSFYGKIVDTYLVDPAGEISDELSNEYKLIVKKYRKTCQY